MPSFVFANNFACTIKSVTDVDSTGNLSSDTDWFRLGKVNDIFYVDSETGKITGSEMLTNDNAGTPHITKKGKNNSFIALTQHQSGDISLIKIYTHKQIMSFYYVATFVGLATGTCIYQ